MSLATSPITAELYREKASPLRLVDPVRPHQNPPTGGRNPSFGGGAGCSPGSEWLVTTAIYFHSRRTGTPKYRGKFSWQKVGFPPRAGLCAGFSVGMSRFAPSTCVLHWKIGWSLSGSILNRVMPPDSASAIPRRPETAAPERPGLFELFVAFAKMSLAGFGGVLVWAARHRRSASLDDAGGIQRSLRALSFLTRSQHR